MGTIISWNGLLTVTTWNAGPALATGCTVVLKPAAEAPLTSLRLAELCQEAGVLPGVVNVVTGYSETAGAALWAHPNVNKVAFTGSHVTGQKIIQASAGNLKRMSLELGGKSLETVFANFGQICNAGMRPFVERRSSRPSLCRAKNWVLLAIALVVLVIWSRHLAANRLWPAGNAI